MTIDERNELFNKHYKLIFLILNKMRIHNEDCEQEAAIALLKAIESYKPERGYSFTTYACVCIRNKIYDYFKKEYEYNKLIKDLDPELIKDLDTDIDSHLSLNILLSSLNELDKSVAKYLISDTRKGDIRLYLSLSEDKLKKSINKIRYKLIKYLQNN